MRLIPPYRPRVDGAQEAESGEGRPEHARAR